MLKANDESKTCTLLNYLFLLEKDEIYVCLFLCMGWYLKIKPTCNFIIITLEVITFSLIYSELFVTTKMLS